MSSHQYMNCVEVPADLRYLKSLPHAWPSNNFPNTVMYLSYTKALLCGTEKSITHSLRIPLHCIKATKLHDE